MQRVVWIENGMLKNLAYSRFWARSRASSQPAVVVAVAVVEAVVAADSAPAAP